MILANQILYRLLRFISKLEEQYKVCDFYIKTIQMEGSGSFGEVESIKVVEELIEDPDVCAPYPWTDVLEVQNLVVFYLLRRHICPKHLVKVFILGLDDLVEDVADQQHNCQIKEPSFLLFASFDLVVASFDDDPIGLREALAALFSSDALLKYFAKELIECLDLGDTVLAVWVHIWELELVCRNLDFILMNHLLQIFGLQVLFEPQMRSIIDNAALV